MNLILKKVVISSFLFTLCMTGVYAYSYSSNYGGSSGSAISWKWWTGWSANGDYTEAVASNREGHPAYSKRAYARSGTEGSYSEWKFSSSQEARVKDYGPYGTNLYEAHGYWDYDQ